MKLKVVSGGKKYILEFDEKTVKIFSKSFFSSKLLEQVDLKNFALNAVFDASNYTVKYHDRVFQVTDATQIEYFNRLKEIADGYIEKRKERDRLRQMVESLTARIETILKEILVLRGLSVIYVKKAKENYVEAAFNMPEDLFKRINAKSRDPLEIYNCFIKSIDEKVALLQKILFDAEIPSELKEKVITILLDKAGMLTAGQDSLLAKEDIEYSDAEETVKSLKDPINEVILGIKKVLSAAIPEI